ncbi:MAG: hypothetical protein K5668_09050 [Lachnospiraceae bacterium]|nr:hypothetical protein [Lachnospiraceae bacterium]
MPSYTDDGFLIVKEMHSCEHFEPVPGRLFCMKECWYCKWAGFQDDETMNGDESSVCKYPGNARE